MLLNQLLVFTAFSITDIVTITTTGYSKYELAPFNARETKSIVFKVKGSIPDVGHVGLFGNASFMSTFIGKPFYEIYMGGWNNSKTGIRKVGASGSGLVNQSTPGIISTEFRQFWVSWEEHVIAIGHGSNIGDNLIVSLNDNAAPMPVNYVAFTSFGWGGNDWSHTWKFNNIDLEIPKIQTQQCHRDKPIQLPMFPLNATANEIINDNDASTCIQVIVALPSTFIRMLIHDWSRPNLQLFLNAVPSCEKSGIMVFSQNGDCPLLVDQLVNGMTACTYNCTAAQSIKAKITLGFLKPSDRSPHWELCEVKTTA